MIFNKASVSELSVIGHEALLNVHSKKNLFLLLPELPA